MECCWSLIRLWQLFHIAKSKSEIRMENKQDKFLFWQVIKSRITAFINNITSSSPPYCSSNALLMSSLVTVHHQIYTYKIIKWSDLNIWWLENLLQILIAKIIHIHQIDKDCHREEVHIYMRRYRRNSTKASIIKIIKTCALLKSDKFEA